MTLTVHRAIRAIRDRRPAAAAVTPAARRPLAALTALAGAAVLAGCGLTGGQVGMTTTDSQSPSAATAPAHHAAPGSAAASANASAQAALPQLTPLQLAGQRVIFSYRGLNPPSSLLSWIRHGEVAGVIFFSGNISSKSQIASVIKKLDAANASADNPLRADPLLLMTDQEGGAVRRLPGAPELSEKQIGQSAQPFPAARTAGTGAGKNLASVGMNVNLAPVLDVYRSPGDFDDQFGRSYSMDPGRVSRLGTVFIKAQQGTGVAATGKHFPGLGAATRSQNTDERPVTLNVSASKLRSVDEFPYSSAIAAGLKLVMASWAVYPALDHKRPAGLSRAVIQGELRNRLGFTGVTITDALEAGALHAFGTIPQRATLAAKAGMDLILCSAQSADQGNRARAKLASDYQDNTLDQATFKSSVQRVVNLRASLAK